MGNFTDVEIRKWIKNGERFEARYDGDHLYLRYRPNDRSPRWFLRYQLARKPRKVEFGTYATHSLSAARKEAKTLMARVALGNDVAGEKQQRKRDVAAKIEAERGAMNVSKLADRYFAEKIMGRWKHPNIVRSRIERDIKPAIGKMMLADVRPKHIDEMLKAIVKRGAPTTANDVLRWTKRMFAYAIKRELVDRYNPADVFDLSDAGGNEPARERWLPKKELVQLFDVMRTASGWSHENGLTVKLLLMLAVRKSELVGARLEEFDFDAGVWYLPAERTKTNAAIDIPLPVQALECLRELERLAGYSKWLLPARKMQTRMIPHIDPNTINAALAKTIRPKMKGCEPFTVHDLRRTARTHLEALGVPPHVAERCLNHRLRGVPGIYNQHDYFEERKAALQKWADLLAELETEAARHEIVPFKRVVN